MMLQNHYQQHSAPGGVEGEHEREIIDCFRRCFLESYVLEQSPLPNKFTAELWHALSTEEEI